MAAGGAMLVPVRCFTCGNLIADKHKEYKERIAAGDESGAALDAVGAKRYCCRRMLLTSMETVRQIIPFYEAMHRRHQEVQAELE